MFAEVWLWLIVVSGPLLFGAVEPWSLFILQSLLVLFPLVCALSLPKSEESILKAPFVPSLLVILTLGCLQLITPRPLLGPQVSLLSTVDPAKTSATLVLYACYGAVLICAPRVLARAGAARRLAWVMFILGSAIACIGLLQTAQGNTMIYGLRAVAPDRNPFGPYYNRNHAAALMAMAVPIGVGLAYGPLSLWRRARSFEAKSNLASQAALFALPLGALGVALYLVSSRGANLGLVVASILVFLGKYSDTKAKKVLLALVLFGGGVFFARPMLTRIASISADSDPSVATRVSMYSSGVDLGRDSPLFGVGLGAFSSAFGAYRDNTVDGVVDHLHCDWGEAFLESGIIGFAAVLLGFCVFLYKVNGKDDPGATPEVLAVRAGALVAVVACSLHSIFEFALRIPGNAVFFIATATVACVGTPNRGMETARGGWRAAFIPALAAFVFLVLTGQRLAAVFPEAREAGLPLSSALNRVSVHGRESSSDYHFALAQALIKRAESEPERRDAHLRAAIHQARAGLLYDSVSPLGNRIMAAILFALDRGGDARTQLLRADMQAYRRRIEDRSPEVGVQ